MSSKDVSRFLFQPRKHYAGTRLQQGRSLLDSDYNEGATLDADDWRRAVLDAVGPRGTPNEGFSLGQPVPPSADPPGADPPPQTPPLRSGDDLTGPSDVQIGETSGVPANAVSVRAGTYYLGGHRLELDRPEPIMSQRDFLQMTAADLAPGTSGDPALYYLEAWEQPVTAVEDEELLDRALGGPDTMVRVRRFRQVKLLDVDPDHATCREAFDQLIAHLEESGFASFNCNTSELESNARLRLVFQEGSDGDPCTPDPPAQYLGTENQTLRIMQTDPAHFVWGFDNGAPIYRVNLPGLMAASEDPQAITDPTHLPVELLTPAKDVEHQPVTDRVIEFLPFGALLDGSTPPPPGAGRHFGKAAAEIGVFARVKTGLGDDGVTFTVDASDVLADLRALITQWSDQHPFAARIDPEAASNPARPMYVRFWHMATGETPVLLPTNSSVTGPPLADTGIIPVFTRTGRRGDFWVAALRPDTPQRIVPYDLVSSERGVAPHGPRHFFAPLAVLQVTQLIADDFETGTSTVTNVVDSIHDCRSRMRRLVDAGCTTFTVGDGLHTVGDFTSIQEAIDALPLAGGRISILPGFYKQAFRIENRSNVTVEGCGDATIIETPTGSALPGVASVETSDHVTIANLRLHAVEQPGVHVHDSPYLALAGLSAQAFVPAGSGVTPGGGAAATGLIELHDSSHATLSGLLLEPARRPAVRMEAVNGAEDVTLTDISALGTDDTALAPTPAAAALILMRGMQRVTIRRTSLRTFGQGGVLLAQPLNAVTPQDTDVTLSELTIVAGAHPALETQPGVDISGVRVTLEDSDITLTNARSANAAVVLVGTGVTLRGNTIVAEPGSVSPAWGGIQVRGQSVDVRIHDNDIRGGLGHGITLGSLLWGTSFSRQPTGAAQLTEPDASGIQFVTGDVSGGLEGGTVLPVDEGLISGLTITDNRIADFQTNGISALTVLGLGATGDTALLEIEHARIERNTITDNLLGPFADVRLRSDFLPFPAAAPTVVGNATPLDLRILPFGGIVLATVTGSLVIAGNTIEGNGVSPTLPTNGIFILNGDGIEIVQNKIARNGSVAVPDAGGVDNTPVAGVRAGIAVMLAGNDLGSTGAIDDLIDIDPTVLPQISNSATVALRVYQNSVQQPEGRALHAVATGSVAVDGNFLSSQGFHGAATAGDAFAIGDAVFVQNLGAPWEIVDANQLFSGADFNNPFPGFTTPRGAPSMLVTNAPGSPRRYVGVGGGVLFANNQVIYDWDVKRPVPTVEASLPPPLSYFAVAVLTLDHLCCVGNNFAIRLGGVDPGSTNPPVTGAFPELEADLTEPLLANAFLGGSTVQVARNRFAENVLASNLSMISGAELMNMTSGNLGTHPMFAYQWWVGAGFEPPDHFLSTNNTALFEKHSIDFAHLRVILRDQAKSFFQLLRLPT